MIKSLRLLSVWQRTKTAIFCTKTLCLFDISPSFPTSPVWTFYSSLYVSGSDSLIWTRAGLHWSWLKASDAKWPRLNVTVWPVGSETGFFFFSFFHREDDEVSSGNTFWNQPLRMCSYSAVALALSLQQMLNLIPFISTVPTDGIQMWHSQQIKCLKLQLTSST